MAKEPRDKDAASEDEATPVDAAASDAQPDATDPDHMDGDGLTADAIEDDAAATDATPDAGDAAIAPADDDALSDETGVASDETETDTDDKPDLHEADTEAVPGAVPVASDQTPAATTAVAPPPPSGPGVGAMLLGGLIAGAIGFAVAWFVPQADVAPGIDPAMEDRLAALEAEVSGTEAPAAFDPSGLEGRLGETGSRIDALEASLTETLGDATARIDALAAEVEELAARPVFEAGDTEAAMDEQIAAFEKIVADAGAAARAELDELRADAEAMRAEAETMQEEAIAATEAADRRAAAAALQAALDSGAPFEDALVTLDAAPDALADTAASGVPTLAELRTAYPAAARAALAAAPATEEAEATDGMGRFTSFLRRQTNARSLAPQDGTGTDAILSRAERALNDGDLSSALTELEALPADASAAMSDWLDEAQRRARAVAAAEELVEG